MKDYASPLTTLDIEAAARAHPRLRKVHAGTYPLDALPTLHIAGRPRHIVYNMSPSTQPPGTHWISVWLDNDTTAEVVDSLGFRPTTKEVLDFVRRHASRSVYITTPLQDFSSAACGLYCLSHGMARARGLTLKAWLARFTPCPKNNDRLVQCEFMRELAHPTLFTPRLRNWNKVLMHACATVPRRQQTRQHGSDKQRLARAQPQGL